MNMDIKKIESITLDDIVEIKEEEDAVRELIERLPENQAMAIKLVYMKNLSYKQVILLILG